MRALLVLAAFLRIAPALAAQGTGRIQVVHTSPDPAVQTLDVYLDDELRLELDGLGFREATPWLEFPAGQAVSVVVTRPGSGGQVPYLATNTIVVEDSVDHYVLIDGVLQDVESPQPGVPFRAARVRAVPRFWIGNDPLDRYARVLLYNASPDLADLRYDFFVSADGSGAVGFSLDYSTVSVPFRAPAGDYVFRTAGLPEFGSFSVNAGQIDSEGSGDEVLLFFSGYADGDARGLPGLGFHAVRRNGAVLDLFPVAIPAAEPVASGSPHARVVPNPARGAAAVVVERDLAGPVHVEVLDVLGRVVWRSPTQPLAAGASRLPLDTGKLAPGAYGVRVVDAERGTVRTATFTVAR